MAIELTRRDEFAVLHLNRPEALNALNNEMLQNLSVVLDKIDTSDARALLITGAGDRAFCAGADIKELLSGSLFEQKRRLEFGQAVLGKLSELTIPTVAVINGFAFGGGLELALACTFRLAASNAKVGLPEIKLGMIPAYGGTQRLPRLVGAAQATELIMTGKSVDAKEAHSMGLVNRVIEGDLMKAAISFAREFSGNSLRGLWIARQAIQRSGETTLLEGMKIESDLAALALTTDDAKEGLTAFLEKRKPKFKDK